MLRPGEKAPDFTLPDSEGANRTLSEFLQAGPLILYFYPADFTPGCTKEACSIRDMHDDIVASGLRVVGISPQDSDSHTRFRDTHKLPFTLLSDPGKQVAQKYGVDGPLSIGVRRTTFLVDRDGKVRDAVQADLRIGRHTDFIMNAIALQSGDD